MLALRQRNTESRATARTRGIVFNKSANSTARGTITASAMHLIGALPGRRKGKVIMVRQQIAEGTYDLDKRLEAILGRLLKDVVT